MAKKLNAVARMLKSKKRLIVRLNDQINWVREEAEDKVRAIQRRIRIAQALAGALEKGTLKP